MVKALCSPGGMVISMSMKVGLNGIWSLLPNALETCTSVVLVETSSTFPEIEFTVEAVFDPICTPRPLVLGRRLKPATTGQICGLSDMGVGGSDWFRSGTFRMVDADTIVSTPGLSLDVPMRGQVSLDLPVETYIANLFLKL